jgi:Dolichyl-phosphate-mannose-protein mannosyltransferase
VSERPASGDPLPRSLAVLGLAALAAWVFIDRRAFLAGSPEPLGVDGYWYAVQLRSLLETGHLYYGGPPLALWLMAPLAALTDPVTGAKLGSSLAAAALPVAVYFLARRIAGERAPALLAAALVATSAGAFYLPAEFIKTAIALPIAVGALAALAWALERPSWRRAAVPAALSAAAALCHELGLAFALVGAIAPIALVAREKRRWRAAPLVLVGALAVIVARDAALLGDLVAANADWSIPALDIDGRAIHFRGEPAVAGAIGLLALIALVLSRRAEFLRSLVPLRDRALVIGPALWAVATALPWLDAADPQGLTFRLRAIAFLPLALAAAALVAAALARLGPTARMVAVMFATGLILVRPARYEAPVVRADPDLAAAVAAAAPHLPPGAVVVAPERHIVFMVTWTTRAPARLRPEPIAPAHRFRLLPMAYISHELAAALDRARRETRPPPISLHRGHQDGLVLIAESTWLWILSALPPRERDYYRAWPVY